MFRVLTILAAIVALAVSAAPVASAGPNSKTTGHSAGLAPDFGIYLSLRKAPPKPRGMSREFRSAGTSSNLWIVETTRPR